MITKGSKKKKTEKENIHVVLFFFLFIDKRTFINKKKVWVDLLRKENRTGYENIHVVQCKRNITVPKETISMTNLTMLKKFRKGDYSHFLRTIFLHMEAKHLVTCKLKQCCNTSLLENKEF